MKHHAAKETSYSCQNIQNLLNFRPGDVFFEDSGKTDDRKCTHA